MLRVWNDFFLGLLKFGKYVCCFLRGVRDCFFRGFENKRKVGGFFYLGVNFIYNLFVYFLVFYLFRKYCFLFG